VWSSTIEAPLLSPAPLVVKDDEDALFHGGFSG
jgi:hypothetical protein